MLHFPLTPSLSHASAIESQRDGAFYWRSHVHDTLTQFLLLCEGGGVFTIDGRTYTAEAPALLCYAAGLWHEERSTGNRLFRAYSIGATDFRVMGLPPGLIIARAQPQVIPLDEAFFKFEYFAHAMTQEVEQGIQECGNHWLALFLIELARLVYPSLQRKKPVLSETTVLVKTYVDEHYSEPLTLEQLSAIAHLSPNYLCKLFSREVRVSPIHYLIQRRIETAKHLLCTTDLPISHIAHRCGYESASHFTTSFRHLVGVSPGRYRTLQA